ncbi:hypothetical protein [Nesterenkonia pannonica]|uniref:hypothetical protein n=1 Tax=Nesterenkonia pannonica TaxID=1548602 RepID=UPI00216473C8|nr:hypothetical protein [Nesterenkonia pannonica]
MDAEQLTGWTIVFAGLSALSAIVTALIAAFTLSATRADSRERTRPIVVASVERGPKYIDGTTYVVVGNYGQTAARNVDVSWIQEFTIIDDVNDAGSNTARAFKETFEHPISLLAPGQKLSAIVRFKRQTINHYGDSFPDKLDVSVTYDDGRGGKWYHLKKPRQYSDSFILQLDMYDSEIKLDRGSKDYQQRTAEALESLNWVIWHQ